MKRIISFIALGFCLSNCNSSLKEYTSPIKYSTTIEHYSLRKEFNDFDLWSKQTEFEIYKFVFGEYAIDLRSKTTKDELMKFYEAKDIPNEKIGNLKKIFNFRFLKHEEASLALNFTCEPVYRDILIFRQKEKIVGVAKICFSCGQNFMMISNQTYEDVNIDYDSLQREL